MAANHVSVPSVGQLGVAFCALGRGSGTSCVEEAPLGQVDGAGDLTAQDLRLPPLLRVGDHDGGEQCVAVGVQGGC